MKEQQRIRKPLTGNQIAAALFLLIACLMIAGCTDTEAENTNEAVIEKVLRQEFTGPNEEYTAILLKSLEQTASGEYERLLEDTYSPYFTDSGFDSFKPFALKYQYASPNYKMEVAEIEVLQSKSASKNYYFTVQVEYRNAQWESSSHKIKGVAICPEAGKIGNLIINADAGLLEKIQRSGG